MAFEQSGGTSGFGRLMHRLSLHVTEKSRTKGLSFVPRSDDVFVTTSGKCGTTWMQQIVHQLRSGGDMSFEDISEVVPYIELAYDLEIDIEAEQKYQPRCFKTHAWYPHCPKGGKYIVIYREPCAALYSLFKFLRGWFFDPGEISLHEFVENLLLVFGRPKSLMENASYFEHLVSWWEHRNDENVLFLFFEDMKEDLPKTVRKVASFMGIHDEAKINTAVEMSSFDFMKENGEKFQDGRLASYRNESFGVAPHVRSTLVSTGSATEGRELMKDKTKEIVQAKWLEVIAKKTGYQNYEELRLAFKKEQEKEASQP